jgi:5-hydroxyisourate hydrolase
MSAVTTHVLDTARGRPAEGVLVTLVSDDGGVPLGQARTGPDGRVRELGPPQLPAGTYRLVFDTGGYFTGRGQHAFFPEVVVAFATGGQDPHVHVPLLLSPFAYSTYRGS